MIRGGLKHRQHRQLPRAPGKKAHCQLMKAVKGDYLIYRRIMCGIRCIGIDGSEGRSIRDFSRRRNAGADLEIFNRGDLGSDLKKIDSIKDNGGGKFPLGNG